jgi:hypothetical protein
MRRNLADERMVGIGAAIIAALLVCGLFAPGPLAIKLPLAVVLGPSVWLVVAAKLPPWRGVPGRERVAAIAMCLESVAIVVGALILRVVL